MRGCLNPGEQLFSHDIPGLLAHDIDGLTLNDFKLTWDKTITQLYFTNAIAADNFKDIKIVNFYGNAAPAYKGVEVISLKNGDGLVTDSKLRIGEEQVKHVKLLKN